MSQQPFKSFADFIPQLKQPILPSFGSHELEQSGLSSLIKLSEPASALLSSGNKSQIGWHTSQTPSLSTSRRTEATNNKKLKLKDYLHLNSIEKKSKKESSLRKSELEQNNSVELKKNPLSYSTALTNKNAMHMTTLSQPQIPSRNQDPTEILKGDVIKRIETQISELNDLARYVRSDFKVHESESKAQFLLFNMLNSIVNGSKSYQQVGEQIIQYDKCDASGKKKSREQQFYWQRNRSGLESPAKMIKKGLELTFNLTELLQGRK